MSKGPKLSHEDILQLIHSSPNDRVKKLWEGVLLKLQKDPPKKLEFTQKPKVQKKR